MKPRKRGKYGVASRLCAVVALAAAIASPAVFAADVVTEWNGRTAAAIARHYRFFALATVHVAMFDAINSIERLYTPYKFKVSAPQDGSPEAAGASAAHAVLVRLFPEQKATLDAEYADSLAQITNGPAKIAGIAVGDEVAGKVLAWRASDGIDSPNT